MKKTALFLATLLIAAGAVAQDAASIEGAWKYVKIEKLGPDGWVAEDNIQPNLLILAGGYYSNMYVPAADGKSKPRTLFPDGDGDGNVTDAQKAEAWDTIIANSGMYKVSGSEITFTVLVAKSPNFMNGGSSKASFKVEGDTLTTETTSFSGASMKVTRKRLK